MNLKNQILIWIERDESELVNFCAELVSCNTSSSHGDTLNGHMDVMPVDNKSGRSVEPWSGNVTSDKIIGRGVSDMKSGVATMIFAYKYLRRFKDGLRGRLTLTIDFPVTLPEDFQRFTNADGYKAAHEKIRGTRHFEQLQKVIVDICTIKGGAFPSVIADTCEFTAAIVIPLGTDIERLLDELKRLVKKYPEAALRIDGVDLPDISPAQDELAKILSDTVVEVGKTRPLLTPEIALSDCRYRRHLDTPAYCYGADGELCSIANEFVTIDDLIHVTKVHALSALKYLSGDSNDA